MQRNQEKGSKNISKRGLFLGLIWMAYSTIAFGQLENRSSIEISGRVLDSVSLAPVEFASVSLWDLKIHKPVQGLNSNAKGVFLFSGLQINIPYQIRINFLGYKPKVLKTITLSEETSKMNLGAILLSSNAKTLKGLVVTAKRELIENHLDKLVYNAEKDLTSQGGSATDLLKKIPQISVDIDGNVELAGSSSIRFLINGKPSSAFGSSVADVLQTIPSSQIKSIEVITNPGAKYDAEGLGGIINIILKQNTAQGFNGNISLTAGTRNENGSLNLNYRKGNFGLNGFLSGNFRPQVITGNYSDQFKIIDSGKNESYLHQEGPSTLSRGGYQSGLGFDYSPNKLNSLTGSIGFDLFERKSESQTLQNTFLFSHDPLSNQIQNVFGSNDTLSRNPILDNTTNNFDFHNLDASIDWKRKFKKEDQELEISLSSSFGKGNNLAENQLYRRSGTKSLFPYLADSTHNPVTDQEWELAVDYANPVKKQVIWGYGAKINLRKAGSDILDNSFDTLNHIYAFNPSLSSSLQYHQQRYAVYSEISFPIGENYQVKLGFRYQRTDLSTFFSNAPGQASPPGYNSYLPSFFISRKFKKSQSIKLSFSRRMEPPDVRWLNPYVNITDPNNLTRGNPYLLPETADRLEFNYSKSFEKAGSLSLILFYKTSNNDIQPYSVVYPSFTVGNLIFKNVNVITNENVGLEQDAGFNLFTNIHLTDKLEWRTNTSLYHRYTTNYLNPGLNAQSWNFRSNINFTYTFSTDLNAEFSGSFNSSRSEVQGHYPSFTSYILGLRKTFANKKASLALIAGNFLAKNVNQPVSIQGIDFTTQSNRIIPYRTFGLNFSWKFGTLKFKKEKEEDNQGVENSPDPK